MIDFDLTPTLKRGIIHTWLVDIENPLQEIYSFEKLLSKEELERSRRYRFDQDRSRFIIRRGILRLILSKYAGINPDEIAYSTNTYGKLSLPLQQPHFSTSHSQNKIAYAFSSQGVIGVDIEQVKPLSDPEKLARTWFSSAEIEDLSHLGAGEYLQGFYHVWTQKEALIKARGEGLNFPLNDFSVSVDPRQPGMLLSIKNEDASNWKMLTDRPDPDWNLAVCVRSRRKPKVIHYRANLKGFDPVGGGLMLSKVSDPFNLV